MKKIILKYKIATKLLFVVTIFCFSLSFNITHAADKWFYWYDTPEHEMGSFPTEASCLTAFNTIGSGWTKSDGCYIGGDVKITDFSPMAGGQGSTITITGDNFVRVTKILFGSKVANKSTANISKTSITNLSVPSGAPTGKITIETQARGSAVTTKDFEVTSTNNDPWTFLNIQGQYNGGWATEEECKTKHAEYNTGAGVVPGSSHDTVECVQRPQSQITNSQSLNPVDTDPLKVDGGSGVYKLLAPIGSLEEIDTTGKTCPGNPDIANGIGCYLNIIFKIAIGLCAALAVIMLVINGIKYMTSESFTEKSELKKDMLGPIMGLFIALGAFAILNTINPALTGKDGVSVDQIGIEIINLPDAGDGEIDPGYAKKDYRYSTNSVVSPEVTSVVSKLKQGWEIDYFKVYTNERMLIALKKGSEKDTSNVIDIRSGVNGFSEIGQGRSKDKKTPKGVWKILEIRTSKNGKPVYNGAGANMGATFWLLSPMNSGERGIGMHGNKTGTLSRTFGCVRLKNSDLLALLPYVKKGISVFIGS